jgi:hypothetical protein
MHEAMLFVENHALQMMRRFSAGITSIMTTVIIIISYISVKENFYKKIWEISAIYKQWQNDEYRKDKVFFD